MADISTEIAVIESASRGEEVRDAIVDALNAMNAAVPSSGDQTKINALPSLSASDAGKFIMVDSTGSMVATTIPQAEGVSF